jgi:hypothetical protein
VPGLRFAFDRKLMWVRHDPIDEYGQDYDDDGEEEYEGEYSEEEEG